MAMFSRYAQLFAAVVALAVAWPILLSTAQSDVDAVAHVTEITADDGSFGESVLDPALCGGLDQHHWRDACCGSASVACCPACVLVPAERPTFGPGAAQTYAETLAEAAAGIVPGRLKKPPRTAGS